MATCRIIKLYLFMESQEEEEWVWVVDESSSRKKDMAVDYVHVDDDYDDDRLTLRQTLRIWTIYCRQTRGGGVGGTQFQDEQVKHFPRRWKWDVYDVGWATWLLLFFIFETIKNTTTYEMLTFVFYSPCKTFFVLFTIRDNRQGQRSKGAWESLREDRMRWEEYLHF